MQFDSMLLLYTYQMIFSVNRQFTRAQKCKPTVYILPSEYTPAGGVPTEFWAIHSVFLSIVIVLQI